MERDQASGGLRLSHRRHSYAPKIWLADARKQGASEGEADRH